MMQSLLVYLTSKARKKMIVPHTAGYRPLCPQCEYQKFCSDQVHKVNNHFT